MDHAEMRRIAQAKQGDILLRAIIGEVLDKAKPDGAAAYFARCNDSEAVKTVHRASTTYGSTGSAGWGAEVARTATADFIAGLGPMSAASRLFALAVQPPFPAGGATLNIPAVISEAAGGFIAEGEPIPVVSWDFSAASLNHKKLGIIGAVSRELAKTRGSEAEIGRLLRESAALTLDAALFSSSAATATTPAGLFYGVSATAPGAWGDGDVLETVLTTLAGAVAPIAGDQIAFVTSPARALQISMRYPNLRYPVLATSAIADSRIAVVALNALAVAIDPAADLSVSSEAVLHMSDVPLEIVDDSAAKADPVRSMFQTSVIATRLIIEMDWTLRAAGAVAFVDGY